MHVPHLTVVEVIGGLHLLWMAWKAARRAHDAGERWVNAVPAGVFAYAGARMLLASQAR